VVNLQPEYSNADELVAALAAGVLDLVDEGVQTPIVLIDGRAGSGKSTLADALQRRLFKEGETLPRLIHMDDLYPGWGGLAAGAEYLQRFVLGPIAERKTANWQLFDWSVGARGEWREFSGGTPLIVEGCGALNSQSAELAQFKVWIETPEDVRHERWLAREGNDEHWAAWAAQELDFYAREKSQALAETRLLG
jgi:energy-coupling factor transporter ATP-binding protein EcfA2